MRNPMMRFLSEIRQGTKMRPHYRECYIQSYESSSMRYRPEKRSVIKMQTHMNCINMFDYYDTPPMRFLSENRQDTKMQPHMNSYA